MGEQTFASVGGLGTAHAVSQTALQSLTQGYGLTCRKGAAINEQMSIRQMGRVKCQVRPQPCSQQPKQQLARVGFRPAP